MSVLLKVLPLSLPSIIVMFELTLTMELFRKVFTRIPLVDGGQAVYRSWVQLPRFPGHIQQLYDQS